MLCYLGTQYEKKARAASKLSSLQLTFTVHLFVILCLNFSLYCEQKPTYYFTYLGSFSFVILSRRQERKRRLQTSKEKRKDGEISE